MGGGSSTTSDVTSINTSVTNAMAQAIMNCSGNTMVEQKFTVSGSYNKLNNFKMVQAMSLSATCANNADNLASVQSAVSAAVTAAASSQSVAGLGSLTKSDAEVKVRIQNDVTQNITSQTLTNVINSVNAVQTATISGDNNIISNFEEEQTLVIVQNACQAVVSKMETVQDLAASAEAKADAKQTDPIDSFMKNINDIVGTGFAGANTGFGIIAAVVIAGIIGCVVLLNKFGGKLIDKVPGADITALFKPTGNGSSRNVITRQNSITRRKSISKSSPQPTLKRSLSAPPGATQLQPSAPQPAPQPALQPTYNAPSLTFTEAQKNEYAVGPQSVQQQPVQQQQQPMTQPALPSYDASLNMPNTVQQQQPVQQQPAPLVQQPFQQQQPAPQFQQQQPAPQFQQQPAPPVQQPFQQQQPAPQFQQQQPAPQFQQQPAPPVQQQQPLNQPRWNSNTNVNSK